MVLACIAAGAASWGLNLLALSFFAHAIGANVAWTVFAVAVPVSLVTTLVPFSINGSSSARPSSSPAELPRRAGTRGGVAVRLSQGALGSCTSNSRAAATDLPEWQFRTDSGVSMLRSRKKHTGSPDGA